MFSIPPTPPIPPMPPSTMEGNKPTGDLAQQLQYLMAELRGEMMSNPPDTTALTQIVTQLQNFLNQNGAALIAQCQAEGYPMSGAYNPENELSAAQNLCNLYLDDPTNTTPLILLNESITQLHFEMTNPYS